MRVKPTQPMHAALMAALTKSGCPRRIAKKFIKDGEFNYNRNGLTFHQPDSGYAGRWDGKAWVTIEY